MIRQGQASALHAFCSDTCSWDLEPKEQHDSCPLAGDYMTMYLGIYTVLWVYPHSQYIYIYIYMYTYIYIYIYIYIYKYIVYYIMILSNIIYMLDEKLQ